MTTDNDYLKYRGRCKEYAEQALRDNPDLKLVRGHYVCPKWGKQAHWWCEYPDGTILDPTSKQFPSGGKGEYIPFDGIVKCSECGKQLQEQDAIFDGNGRYAFCSVACNVRFVGL